MEHNPSPENMSEVDKLLHSAHLRKPNWKLVMTVNRNQAVSPMLMVIILASGPKILPTADPSSGMIKKAAKAIASRRRSC